MICCDVLRTALYALIPLVWIFAPQTWLLYLVAPIGAALGMVFQVTYVTAVPNLVGADQITAANGRLAATYAAASVAGPMLAGVVSGLLGPATAIAIDAASFAASAIGLCFVRLRTPSPSDPGAPAVDARRALWPGLLAGTRFLWEHPVLRALTILLSLLTFLTLGLTDVFIYHLKHDLAQPDGTVGYVLAAGAAGTVVAALLVAPARRRLGFGACWIGSYALCGVAVAGVGMAGTVPVIAALVAAYVVGTSIAGICSMSLRQEVTPDHLLGRVTSAFWAIHSALGPLGAALLTAGAERYGVTAVCLVSGGICAAVALSATLTAVRQARPERLVVVVA